MSIPVLIQTYDEVRRLAIAGSVVAPGDFRLKKLAPALDKAGEKAPVFAKVGQSVNRLVESNEKTSATALLELATLVNAILVAPSQALQDQAHPLVLLAELFGVLLFAADKQTEKFLLNFFAQAGRLVAIKGEPSGKDVLERLVEIMLSGTAKVQAALVEAHATLPSELLSQAFLAACRSCKPADVFAKFSPYLAAKVDEKKKGRDPAYAKREAIIEVLVNSRSWHHDAVGSDPTSDLISGLDPKWLDLAVKLGRADLVQALAVPGHAKANALLATFFQQQLGKSAESYELIETLSTMIRVGHPSATDAAIELIMRSATKRPTYYTYWVGHLLPRLPKAEALPKLEALLPTLPEKMIDQILDYIAELKNA